MARNSKKKTQEQKSLPFIQPDAAGIDIGATEIYVAVPEERDIRPVRKFATFTEDLHALADWLSNQNGGHGIDRSLLDRPFPDPGAPGFGSLPGQRPPCQRGAGARQTVAKSLVGDYRPEHLFSLQQALENYRHFQNQIAACDQHIERMLARFDSQEQCAEAPSTKYKAQGNQPSFNVPSEMHRILGVDLTAIPGMSVQGVLNFFCEVGPQITRFPSSKHFASWLGLCPDNRISGGKILSSKTRNVRCRLANALRMAATTLYRSHSALGDYFRRLRARLGSPAAITAAAHKLARILFAMLRDRRSFDPQLLGSLNEKHLRRRQNSLRKYAARF
jgi:transposase